MGNVLVAFRQSAKRLILGFTAIVITLTGSGLLLPQSAGATGGQVTGRSILLSSSAPSATTVTYTVNFTTSSSGAETHPDVIIDFCSNDPIIGDSCTATAGTDTPNFTSAAASGWTLTTIGSGRGVKLTTSTLSFSNSTPITPIVITGVTNPSNTAGFYGRILTYATGGAGANTSASPGSYVDYGGIALSTTANILITAKVFESLAFCVFQTTCGTQANLTLGDPTTGLSSAQAYDNSAANYTIATNAQGGVNVTMTGTTLCRSATPANCNTGTSSIYTITSVGATPLVRSPGSEQFGMCVDITGATGLTVGTSYIDAINNCHSLGTGVYAGTSKFGFNDSTSSGGTNNAAGSQVLSSTTPVTSYTGVFTFLGDIASTTEAGIYTTSLNMVATGTF